MITSLLQIENFVHYSAQQTHQHTLYEKGQTEKVRGQMKAKEMQLMNWKNT